MKPHWSFWLIGVVALIWNLMGCLNFVMQFHAPTVARMPDAYQGLIVDRPFWATLAFGLGVFGGAVGAVILLARRAMAKVLFQASVIGIVIVLAYSAVVVAKGAAPVSALGGAMMSLVIAVALVWYTGLARNKGWIG